MSRASLGSVFQRRYRDRTGVLCRTRNWYIEYTLAGRATACREATPFTSKADAQRLLRQRMGDADAGKVALKPETTFEELKQLILADYEINRRDSLYDLQRTRLPKLTEFFGTLKAVAVKTRDVECYKLWRLGLRASQAADSPGAPVQVLREARRGAKGAAPATVNRELAALKRMFRLAIDQELIATRPRIVLLKEDNVRTGFFEWDEFVAFLAHLPSQYQALFQVAYITGWRVRSELLTRLWSNVEFNGRGCLRIEPGEAKDAREGREFPFTDWMREVLEAQRALVRQTERKTGKVIPWVFCQPNGRPILNFTKAWRQASATSGIRRMPHDLRRTAVRNLERAGVPRAAAMKMVGHKTESIYKRYSIVDHAMLILGADKLNRAQKHKAARLRPLSSPEAAGAGVVH